MGETSDDWQTPLAGLLETLEGNGPQFHPSRLEWLQSNPTHIRAWAGGWGRPAAGCPAAALQAHRPPACSPPAARRTLQGNRGAAVPCGGPWLEWLEWNSPPKVDRRASEGKNPQKYNDKIHKKMGPATNLLKTFKKKLQKIWQNFHKDKILRCLYSGSVNELIPHPKKESGNQKTWIKLSPIKARACLVGQRQGLGGWQLRPVPGKRRDCCTPASMMAMQNASVREQFRKICPRRSTCFTSAWGSLRAGQERPRGWAGLYGKGW